ncbi:MBL fold metallo-hydrolase [bacterium]|nr:MBL fold metallo-hydrolase [bacterium]
MEIIQIPVAPIGANCYIVSEGKEAFIIDPGGDAGKIIRAAKNFGVRYILLTHTHFDHIGGLNDVKNAFPEAKTAVHNLEKEWLYSAGLNFSEDFGFSFIYEKEIDIELKDGMKLDFAGTEINVLHTPGHTPGSTCFYIKKSETCGSPVLFSGDTLFRHSIGRTDFPGGSGRKIIESIKNKLLVLPDNTVVYPGHDETTSIALEKKLNPFL